MANINKNHKKGKLVTLPPFPTPLISSSLLPLTGSSPLTKGSTFTFSGEVLIGQADEIFTASKLYSPSPSV